MWYIWVEIIDRGKSRHKDSTGEWKRARAGWSMGESKQAWQIRSWSQI